MLVIGTEAKGKHLLTRLDSGLTLHTHLRMDGAWRTDRVAAPWRGGPAWQARVILANDAYRAIGFRLPVVDLIRASSESAVVGHLGPDIATGDFDLAEAVRRVESAPSDPIGLALLEQRHVAGLGNVYRLESCFMQRVNPWLSVADTDVSAVLSQARRLMLANLDHGERTTTGDRRPGRRYWVYERERRPCWRCGTPILGADQGRPPQQRVTFWCPRCQPAVGSLAPRRS